jgi:amidohydrolase
VPTRTADLEVQARRLSPTAVALRRQVHSRPELGFAEHATQRLVVGLLEAMGLRPVTDGLGTGVVATVHGRGTGPAVDVALRAELDALPIGETTGLPFASTVPGVSHACGHDAHLAALVATAQGLVDLRDSWAGRVTLLFQPAEELPPGGALTLLGSGLIPPGCAVYGAHLASDLPTGLVSVTSGPLQSSNDRFEITLQGRGGHGAMPEQTRDALLAASHLVTALQTVVSRRVSALDAAVVTVGTLHSGEAFNAIADTAHLGGTIRTLDPAVRDTVRDAVVELTAGVSAAHGCGHTVDFPTGYPALVNDAATAEATFDRLTAVLGPGQVVRGTRSRMESDDFAYYLERHRGNFFFVGSGGEDPGTRHPHHHPAFDLDERAITTIITTYLALVLP